METAGDDAGPGRAEPAISRRRVLAGAMLAGAAAALAACSPDAPAARPDATPSPAPSTRPAVVSGAGFAAPAARDTPAVAENALPGDPGWDADRSAAVGAAYLGAASVGPGEPLVLRARGEGVVQVDWYRLGWYGGAGARLLRSDAGIALGSQPSPTIDPGTGLVEAGWSPVLRAVAPTDVRSGMLLAVLRTPDGRIAATAPIVLRPDPTLPRRAPVLFVSAASTWQAYNPWGGLDLYHNRTRYRVPATGGRRAVEVSFDRPYAEDAGAGHLRSWELQLIRWMERNGRDVDYIADLDLERQPWALDGRRLLVFAGHPEYWSRPMRERVEAAVASGTSVAFLSADEVYWQMRLGDGPAGPATRITCYKSQTRDPLRRTAPALTTCRWRESPVSEPEATLIGEMYGSMVRRVADWVVAGSSHWVYEGTGLADGDRIANLVGREYDTFIAAYAQPGTLLLANGPVDAVPMPLDPGARRGRPVHNATVYTAPSGATVFAAGTFQWSWALDDYGDRSYLGVRTPTDDRVARMTRNLFDRLGDGPLLA